MVRKVGKNRKCKCRGIWEEDWMSAPITFPSIPSDDVSNEQLIVEAEIEGHPGPPKLNLHGIAEHAMPFFDTLKNIMKENKVGRKRSLQHRIYAVKRNQRPGVGGLLERGPDGNWKCRRAGLVLIDPTRTEYTYAIRLNFASTNNEANYEALLVGLRIARKMKVLAVKVKVDSKLVACQMNVEFVASSDGMAKYLMKAKELSAGFEEFSIENVPQNQNQNANVVSKLASVAYNHLTKENDHLQDLRLSVEVQE
nr:reverse transcriptase domain-containing protein [Tanacetum cinerariifolium]